MELKQVIVMRNDLNMRKGKMIAQGAHAAMISLLPWWMAGTLQSDDVDLIRCWVQMNGMKKICVRAESEEELQALHEQAVKAGLISNVITDAGHTEFDGPTVTCLAIGPNDSAEIDKITGHLKLL